MEGGGSSGAAVWSRSMEWDDHVDDWYHKQPKVDTDDDSNGCALM